MNRMTTHRDILQRILAVAALAAATPAAATSGTEGAAFLDIPVGARPAALGGAYSALATDGYAPVWNPAGLGALDAKRLSLTHLDHLEADYEFAGYAHPLRADHGVGAAVQYYRPGKIGGLDATGAPIGDVKGHYGAYTLAYGASVAEWLSLGAAGKLVRASIDGVTGSAYAADLGALYRPTHRLSVALVMSNLGSKLEFLEQADDLPRTLRAGLALRPWEQVSFLAEGLHARSGLAAGRAGVEWRPGKHMAIRAGYKTDTARKLSPMAGVSAGLGVFWAGQEFSYAWTPHGDLGFTQHFSLALRFGGPLWKPPRQASRWAAALEAAEEGAR